MIRFRCLDAKAIIFGVLSVPVLAILVGVISGFFPYEELIPLVNKLYISDFLTASVVYFIAGGIAGRVAKSHPAWQGFYAGVLVILIDIVYDFFIIPMYPYLQAIERYESSKYQNPVWVEYAMLFIYIAIFPLGAFLLSKKSNR